MCNYPDQGYSHKEEDFLCENSTVKIDFDQLKKILKGKFKIQWEPRNPPQKNIPFLGLGTLKFILLTDDNEKEIFSFTNVTYLAFRFIGVNFNFTVTEPYSYKGEL